MKKVLLLSCLLAKLCSVKAQSFIPGNLVVSRYGDGAAALADKTVAVFLDEYQPTASLPGIAAKVQTRALPTTTVGTNYRLTGLPRGATNYVIEGYTTLSADGQYLVVMGHDQATNSAATSSVNKVIGRVDAAGNILTSTYLPASEVSAARGAVTNDGTGFWVSPPTAGTGVRYVGFGNSSTTATVASTATSVRTLTIFGGQLYGASGSNTFYTIGTGLPTTAGNTAAATALPSTIANSQMVFFDLDAEIAGPDVIYAVDDNGGTDANATGATLRKFKYNGTSWTAAGTVSSTATTNLKSITGTLVGNDVLLYGVTWGLTSGSTSSLLKFDDKGAWTSTISNAATSPFLLASAPANTQFRGVTFTPGTKVNTTLPVELTSLQVKPQAGGIRLSWATLSEQNNSHFEVLRSSDRNHFISLGTIKGNGTTSTRKNYTFLDENPIAGYNYYQLVQFDFDGRSTKSDIVSANFLLKKQAGLAVSQLNANSLRLNVNGLVEGAADLKIINISGQVVQQGTLILENGHNVIDVDKTFAATGLFITVLSQGREVLKSKFILN
ncbi:hypothetical protein [Desertivirga xinjiangensis]|uniref:hypothetical protein n=1 Tax=Desertivirga xinjiangensis TaxID=539206 RepID=UPI00210CFAFA|nr:hypothetical protein [Pedobacter xinjiangensis]